MSLKYRIAAAFTAAAICGSVTPFSVFAELNNECKVGVLDITFSDDGMDYTIEDIPDKGMKTRMFSAENSMLSSDVENLPLSYSAYDKNVVTPIKNQGESNSCWAFSAIACAEHSLVSQGIANNSIDLSEAALTWFSQNTKIGGSEGTLTDNAFVSGGNWIMAALAMSRYSGVEYEDFEPFLGGNTDKINVSDYQRDVCEYHLKTSRSLPKDNPDRIKEAVMENGGVSVSYYANDSYFSEDFESYYNPDAQNINHAVTIIGWDDNYSADNFAEDNRPSSDGAWLVKGSWGDFSEDGCYYISYEEPELKYFCTYEMQDGSSSDNVYTFTDGTNMILTYAENSMTAANVFTCDKSENLSEVSFFLMNTMGSEVTYNIKVYKEPSNGSPISNDIIAEIDGSVDCDGYYTVPIDSKPLLNSGEKFSVVLTLTYTGQYSYMVCEGGGNSTSNMGESYVLSNGKWYDCCSAGYNNVYINAYTCDNSAPEKSVLGELIAEYENTSGMAKEIDYGKKIYADDNASVSDVRNAELLIRAAAENASDLTVISTAEEWNNFAYSVRNGNSYEGQIVVLENDIDFDNADFISAGDNKNSFTGVFDGNGYILRNITYENDYETASVFPNIEDYGCIKNLVVENGFFSGRSVGGIAGTFNGESIKNCGFNGTLNGSEHNGAITAQFLKGVVDSCYSVSDASAFGVKQSSLTSNIYENTDEPASYLLNTSGGSQNDSGKWTVCDGISALAKYGQEPTHLITFKNSDETYTAYTDYKGYTEFPCIPDKENYALQWSIDDEIITADHAFTSDTEVIVKYVKSRNFTISYELNGGQNSELNPTVINPEDVFELYEPEKDGYIFGGWFESEDFSGEPVTKLANVNTDICLFAKWISTTCKVTFVDVNSNVIAEVTVEKGSSVEAPTAPDVTGKYFSHWDTDLSCITDDITVRPVYVSRVNISSCSISGADDLTYSGAALKQDNMIVSFGGKPLSAEKDYSIVYYNNVNVGTCTAIIAGKGNCYGFQRVTFKILPKSTEDIRLGFVASRYYTGKEVTPKVSVWDGEKQLTLDKDYTLSYENNINAGEASILVNFMGNYSGVRVKPFTIMKCNVMRMNFPAIGSFTYTGEPITPKVTAKNGAVKLKEGTDYTVEYSNNVNPGLASATLTFQGNFTGTRVCSFVIYPKSISLTEVTKVSSGSFKASWNRFEEVTGYQICYSESADFKNYKSVTVPSNNTVSKTVSSLKAGKTYYVKIRTYTQLNPMIKAFGKYSAVVSVKV